MFKVVNGSNLSIIQGKKTFKSQVIVENGVSLSSLNKEVLQQVFSSRLSKSKQQHITGFYTMRKSKMGNYFISCMYVTERPLTPQNNRGGGGVKSQPLSISLTKIFGEIEINMFCLNLWRLHF